MSGVKSVLGVFENLYWTALFMSADLIRFFSSFLQFFDLKVRFRRSSLFRTSKEETDHGLVLF
ncbi:hypothetical protein CH380_10265 [Leptospira adleri]|uniref:Uncharacterized protein n=1 Tax=Leptospira adleri TaxID=2023186 RepID=A0A2M9YNU8_9LEPT|nr:hypothetical protein CH380_10265 [Leptospira adleri]PJZ64002.1 hypothetical protein CH376_00845 [Leptospira adleri]